jgi:hypothetical protein
MGMTGTIRATIKAPSLWRGQLSHGREDRLTIHKGPDRRSNDHGPARLPLMYSRNGHRVVPGQVDNRPAQPCAPRPNKYCSGCDVPAASIRCPPATGGDYDRTSQTGRRRSAGRSDLPAELLSIP